MPGAGSTYVTYAPPITGNLTALNGVVDGVTDLIDLASVRLQVTGTWVGTVTFQSSIDGVNWSNRALLIVGGAANNSTGSNNVFHGDVGGRYFRAQMTAYTSGTAVVTILYTNLPINVSSISQSTYLRSTSSADAVGLVNIDEVAIGAYNGTTIDRLVNSAGALASPGQSKALHVASGSGQVLSINAATAVGAGGNLDNNTGRAAHTMQVDVTTTVAGTAGTHVVRLEGSLDQTNWTPILTLTLSSNSTTATDISNHAFGSVSDIPTRYLRANWTTIPTGWTGTLSARLISA